MLVVFLNLTFIHNSFIRRQHNNNYKTQYNTEKIYYLIIIIILLPATIGNHIIITKKNRFSRAETKCICEPFCSEFIVSYKLFPSHKESIVITFIDNGTIFLKL